LGISAIFPATSRGVSKSSMTESGLGLPDPVVQVSECSDGLRKLKVEAGRDLIVGLPEGGGIDILARSACISEHPGSAWRPFLLVIELSLDAEDRL
jgi:hypothetical protein